MHDNRVSEKAVWEGSITHDDEVPFTAPQGQSQPQMMFCYKCNQVIPGNSTFCPYCQVKLFTECPKCGVKYSSQYPSCSQCGTNREEYLQMQRREQKKKEAIEQENRRQREIQERKRLEEERRIREEKEEKERQKRMREYELSRKEQLRKEEYKKENIKIRETDEYKSLDSLLRKALDLYKEEKKKKIITVGISIILTPTILFLWASFASLLLMLSIMSYILYESTFISGKGMIKFLSKYISSNGGCNNEMISNAINSLRSYEFWDWGNADALLAHLPQICIDAYRKKNGLPIIDDIDLYR